MEAFVYKTNPFLLSVGMQPSLLVDRQPLTDRIIENFNRKLPITNALFIAGARGTGKTVLLTTISKEMKKLKDWIVIQLDPTADMIESFACQLYQYEPLNKFFIETKIDLSFFGIGVSVSDSKPANNLQTAICNMLEVVKKKKNKVLICIDEIGNNISSRQITSFFQIATREGYPVFMLVSGLYENINRLQNEENNSFLRRVPKEYLQPLDIKNIEDIYSKIFGKEYAGYMANITEGYSFAFQLLGLLCWENGKKMDISVLEKFDMFLKEHVYDRLWNDLSDIEKNILLIYCKIPENVVRAEELRKNITLDSNELNVYKTTLKKKGIIYSPRKGYSKFALPRFREYIKNLNSDNDENNPSIFGI